MRQALSVPLLSDLRALPDNSMMRISRKGELAKAICYSRRLWTALCRFTEDDSLEMANTAAERAIRPPA